MEPQHQRPVKSSREPVVASVILGLLLLLAAASPILAQGDQPTAPSPTQPSAPTPIPASQIPAGVGEVAAILRGIEANAKPQGKSEQIAEALPAVTQSIEALESEMLPLLEEDGPPQVLREADAEVVRIERKLTGWLDTLKARTIGFDRNLDDLRSREESWELTRNQADAADLPIALVNQVDETLRAIARVELIIRDRRAEVLTVQARVAEQRSRLRTLTDQLQSEIQERQEHLLRLDSPTLWRAFGQPRADDLGEQVLETAKRNFRSLENFIRDNLRGVVQNLAIFAIVFALFIRLGRKARLWVRSDESLRTTAAILQRPVAASLLICIGVAGSLIYPTAPTAFISLMGLILLLVMLRLLPFLVRSEMRPAIGMLVALVALYLLVDLVPNTFFLHRAGELLLAVLGAATCGWVLHRERSLIDVRKNLWYWAGLWLATIATVLFSISVFANVIGAVAFGSLVSTATLGSIYDTITIWMFVVVFEGATTVALRTTTARRLLIVRYHSDRILAAVFRVIKVVAALTWFKVTLDNFGLFDWVFNRLKSIVLYEFHLGSLSLSVSSIGVFVISIWFSIKLSQLIRFVLDEDVMPRLDLPKGIPATVSKTSTYVILTIGFVIAVGAAGLDLSQLTIVIGALSVGIGFGLQNVVNNFVSGLILLFERPVNLGDRIQVGEISGVVKDIGIRASVVRNWQGADVIVPNAALISDNLINWTLSDQLRRMEIQVGVKYGTPPKRVVELLLGVAGEHPGVVEDPAPVALFTGFGDSSLNFELRAWTVDDFVAIGSDLRVGIEQTLAEHEIEIPFPQRDLHLKTVNRQAAAGLAGKESELGIDSESDVSPPSLECESDEAVSETNT